MSYYNPHGHGGAPPSSPCPSPSPPPPPPQGYPMDPYAERGMEHHHHHQYGPPPPQPMYASPYGQPPPPPMYQQPYGQPVYASPYGQPPPPPAMYPPPYAQPPPPPPRKTGASFAEGWYVRTCPKETAVRAPAVGPLTRPRAVNVIERPSHACRHQTDRKKGRNGCQTFVASRMPP
ncbi:hypothetical protein ZEAMMB73_Zm00001d048161 [Zea mays]|uniref:Uncharacterized protein n=2 Tax=Zea mays TaxID=4577 RepID=A0A1D6PI70_MAIZE|nr:hypothetical protein ZEAMMB73_Zm00001d048161 [Zea mays]